MISSTSLFPVWGNVPSVQLPMLICSCTCTVYTLAKHLKIRCGISHAEQTLIHNASKTSCLLLAPMGPSNKHFMLTSEDILSAEQHSSFFVSARGFRTVNSINRFSHDLAILFCNPKTRQKTKLKKSCFSQNMMNSTLF